MLGVVSLSDSSLPEMVGSSWCDAHWALSWVPAIARVITTSMKEVAIDTSCAAFGDLKLEEGSAL